MGHGEQMGLELRHHGRVVVRDIGGSRNLKWKNRVTECLSSSKITYTSFFSNAKSLCLIIIHTKRDVAAEGSFFLNLQNVAQFSV